MRNFFINTILFITLLTCCVQPYDIKSISYKQNLVVDGFISTELKQHRFTLSRTSAINNPKLIPEIGASVSIKAGNGTILLTESSPGIYLTPPLQGVINQTYQLLISTQDGKQYSSEVVTLKYTPEIKDIYATYSPQLTLLNGDEGFQFFLNTEDTTHQTHFYRWEFEETYEIQTPFESNFVWISGNNVVFRNIPVSTCYATDTSHNIIIASTQGFSSDKINGQLIQTLSGGEPYMRVMYSILVKQYSLSENAYLYWETLKNINQNQGTLYDIQPGNVKGNITSADGNESVLGYFDAAVISEKRVFFRPADFAAAGYEPPAYESYCSLMTQTLIPDDQIGAFYAQPGNSYFEIVGATGFGPSILHLLPKQCSDCTSLGTNIKPSYWP
jgi:hypothetical protein